MHHYYALTNDDRTSSRLKLALPAKLKTPFANMPPVRVLQAENASGEGYRDWLPFVEAQPLLSDEMKRILEMYNKHIRWKQVHLIHPELNHQALYWIPWIPEVEGTSIHTEFYPHDHTLKRLVLDLSRVKGHHFFRLAGIREPYFIVSLEAAESLLRRSLTGFRLHKLELM